MTAYRLRDAVVRHGAREALRVEHLALTAGEFVAVIGPNGAGKSTLASLLAGLRPGYTGECALDGCEVRAWKRRELSRAVAFLPQSIEIAFPFTAREVALMGRAPFGGQWSDAPGDVEAADRALTEMGVADLADRDFRTLSGGEKRRVALAAAFATDSPALVLDEPDESLDPRPRLAVYAALADRARAGRLVVAVTHDVRLAARYCTRVVALRNGRIDADGPAAEVLRPEVFRRVFEADPSVWLG